VLKLVSAINSNLNYECITSRVLV